MKVRIHSLLRKPRYHQSHSTSGFTIVELLVVIVVIGILAAITIVAYTGISQRAIVGSLQSDLSNSANKLKMYLTEHGTYPAPPLGNNNCPTSPVADTNYCLKASPGNTYSYSSGDSSGSQTFCLLATHSGTSYNITNDSAPTPTTGAPTVVATATGGVTTTDVGCYRIHTFTGGGTLTFTAGGSVDIVVSGAGGGGGGYGDSGDGGDGGGLSSLTYSGTGLTYSAYGGGGGGGGGGEPGEDGASGNAGQGSGGGAGGAGGGYYDQDGAPGGNGGTTANGLVGTTGGGSAGGAGGTDPWYGPDGSGGHGGPGGRVSGTITVTSSQTATIVVGSGGHAGRNGVGGGNGVVTIRYLH